jgi:hypothetical protein
MWLLSRIGALEVLFLFLAVALGCCFGQRGLRWLAATGPLLILSILLSGPDLFGMLVVASFLILAFALGIYWAPHLGSSERGGSPKNGGMVEG